MWMIGGQSAAFAAKNLIGGAEVDGFDVRNNGVERLDKHTFHVNYPMDNGIFLVNAGFFRIESCMACYSERLPEMTMSLRDWIAAMNRFAIEFEGRLPE